MTSLFRNFVRENFTTLQALYNCYVDMSGMEIGFLYFAETMFYKY